MSMQTRRVEMGIPCINKYFIVIIIKIIILLYIIIIIIIIYPSCSFALLGPLLKYSGSAPES